MQSCPECGSKVQRSHARTLLERLRKHITTARLHRCIDCGWRGWGLETPPAQKGGVIVPKGVPDLRAIDAALEKDVADASTQS